MQLRNETVVGGKRAASNLTQGTDSGLPLEIRGAKSDFHALINFDQDRGSLVRAQEITRSSIASIELTSVSRSAFAVNDNLLEILSESVEAMLLSQGDSAPLELEDHDEIRLLKQLAPTALTEGCLLQHVARADTAYTAVHALLTAICMAERGPPVGRRPRASLFHEALFERDIELPDIRTRSFSEHTDLFDFAFALPVMLLSIGHFPRSYLPELLGLNIACQFVTPTRGDTRISPTLRSNRPWHSYFQERSPSGLGNDSRHLALRAAALHLEGVAVDQRTEIGSRVLRGVALGRRACDEWWEGFRESMEPVATSPYQSMAELLRRKSRFAYGYHGRLMLGDRLIDDWFDPDHFDAHAMMHALEMSRYVVHGKPAGSPILRDLIAPGGAMFRVFSEEERVVISEWITSLAGFDTVSSNQSEGELPGHERPALMDKTGSAAEHETNAAPPDTFHTPLLGARELFYQLVNIERFPDAPTAAAEFVDRWLGKITASQDRAASPFRSYSPEMLDHWVAARHRAQVTSYRPLEGPPAISRDELIDTCVQRAPAVLVDGAWLHGISTVCFEAACAKPLRQIFYDEVGNGCVEANHANVYHSLLAEMEVELPRLDSLEFSTWNGFHDSSFDVAALWLSVGCHPRRYLPEILGINLIAELAGVGGAYREASDALRHYGFDPHFADLHNLTDNASVGHVALAVDAIKLHLEAVAAAAGVHERQRQAMRIWSGCQMTSHSPTASTSAARRLVDSLGATLERWLGRKSDPLH